ncbi:MAG: class II fructose-bisphosphate aldolase [Patescibacteria group bacterium]|nr:class II fructose-bisphosphate aldolase [Patescibacteria group bacterium]MCL5261806.1 class II fructose-bisphosphate aldolase [Patescibacteria group bacterium]
MKQLIDYINEAKEGGYGLGHFNFSDLETLRGIMAGFEEVQNAVSKEIALIVGLSEGERAAVGLRQAVCLIQSYREAGVPVFLNADHTKSLENAKEAAEAGFDAVLFDAGREPLDENIGHTREAVKVIREINPKIIIEGELGFLGEGSEIRTSLPEGVGASLKNLTAPEEVARFAAETGVDLIAPAVGNIHGVITDNAGAFQNPPLDVDRIKRIKEAVNSALVLHGGSGIKDEELRAAVVAGAAVVHISTELRMAWRRGLDSSLAANPGEIAPYKLLAASAEAVRLVVSEKLKLLNSVLY